MFVARTYNKYKGKIYERWWIMRTYRKNGVSKHEYLMNITDLTPTQRENIKKILRNPQSSAIMENELRDVFRSGEDYGSIAFFLSRMQKIGIIPILSNRLSKKNLSLIAAVLLNRILKPSSKMAAIKWIKTTSFVHFSSLNGKDYHPNRVYEAMDEVYNNMDSILNEFYHLSSKKPRLMLYDITSVFFEGDNVEMAKRGYSRDKREDRPQVLLGLVLNEYGLPIHFEVMEGNVKDSTTVKKTVKKIKKRFNLKKGIFVGDRGMINSENVEAITGEGFGYIMALKHKTAKEFLEKKGIQAELFENRVPITIFVDGKEKQYVLCGSKHRKKRDLETLHEILKRGREALEEVKRMVEKGKIKAKEKVIKRAQKKLTKSNAEKYFDFKYDGRKFTIIEKENEIKKQKIFVDIISLKQRKLI